MTHPAVRDLFQTLSRHPAFQEVLTKALRQEDSELALAGLTPTKCADYFFGALAKIRRGGVEHVIALNRLMAFPCSPATGKERETCLR